MEELGAYVCKANIPSEGLEHNRKKKGFALGFRVLFEESVKDGELGIFFPFGAALSEKVINIINNNLSLAKTISINRVGHVIPISLNGSFSEGVFISMKHARHLFRQKINEGYKITSNNHLTIIGKTMDVFAHDLRNNLKNLPIGSIVYCVEKIEGKNVDIEFRKTIFGRMKYKINSDLHKEEVKRILTNVIFNEKGKIIIHPKNGEIFNFKIIGRDGHGTSFKTLEVLKPATLTKEFQRKIPFDYNLKDADVYLTSIRRKISKKEIINYTWKVIENRAYENNLKTVPLLREMKVVEHNKLLMQCVGLTDTRSSINNFAFKKGINLFIEHEEKIDRIPYYSFKYIDAYYNSTFLCRANFDLGF